MDRVMPFLPMLYLCGVVVQVQECQNRSEPLSWHNLSSIRGMDASIDRPVVTNLRLPDQPHVKTNGQAVVDVGLGDLFPRGKN